MFRRSGRGRFLLLVFLALSILLITLDYRQDLGVLERAKDVSNTVIAPIQRGLTAAFRPIGNFFGSLGELGRLRDENAELKDRLEDAEAQIDRARAIEEQNREMSQLLGLDESWAAAQKVSAQVIGRVQGNYRWAVFINKGTADGIRADMPVVDENGLVGKIVNAEANVSTVLLLVDPQAGAGARIERERDTGVVTGNGGNRPLSLEFISRKTKVSVGDEITTSGYDRGIFPPAIPIGTVSRVTGDAAELEHEIDVTPHVEFTKLDFVHVILRIGPPAKSPNARHARLDRKAAGDRGG